MQILLAVASYFFVISLSIAKYQMRLRRFLSLDFWEHGPDGDMQGRWELELEAVLLRSALDFGEEGSNELEFGAAVSFASPPLLRYASSLRFLERVSD